MIYSVWDWNRRQFAVYQDQRQRPLMGDPTPCTPAVRAGVGQMIDIGMTLCPLPPDARPIGWSDVAVGQVSRAGGPAYAGRTPGLGGPRGLGLFSPSVIGLDATAGVAPGGGLGQSFSFTEAVVVNILVALVSGVVSNYVFKRAFVSAGKTT